VEQKERCLEYQLHNCRNDHWYYKQYILGNLYFETSDDYEHFGMMIKHSESVVFKGNDQNKKETGI